MGGPTAPRSGALRASVGIFVTWGVLLAISGGVAAGPIATFMHKRFVLMSERTDAMLLGGSIAQLYAADPALEVATRFHLIMLSAVLSGMGISMASLAWAGLRQGSRAALVGLVLTPVPICVWFAVVASQYRANGISVTIVDVPPFVWVGALVAAVGGILGWRGLRQ